MSPLDRFCLCLCISSSLLLRPLAAQSPDVRPSGSTISPSRIESGTSNSASAYVLTYSTYIGEPGQLAGDGPAIMAANASGDVCALTPYPTPLLVSLAPNGSLIYNVSPPAPRPTEAHSNPTATVAIDANGNCYMAAVGEITPTSGVFQSEPKSGQFVVKFGPTGNIVYATYLGGSGTDVPLGLAVDGGGDVYLTGSTDSNDFPTKNPFQATLGGESDAFIAVLNPTATALIYSTYLGGSGNDSGNAIAVDSAGNAYVTGETSSSNFPMVAAFQSMFNAGTAEAFVTKLTSSGVPVYSTYLSGSTGSQGSGIAADSDGDAYVTGSALSADFPLMNPIQSSWQQSAFVSEFNSAGSALVYSTFWGSETAGPTITVDPSGQAYLAGIISETTGSVPLVSPISSQFEFAIGGQQEFAGYVAALAPAGASLFFSTYLWSGSPQSVAVDSSENIYVSGSSNPFPILNAYNGIFNYQACTSPPQQTCLGTLSESFALKIAPTSGTVLAFPTTVLFTELVPVGSTSAAYPVDVVLANASSSGTVNISNIAITGDFSQTNNCPSALVAASSCLVQVTFAPTAGGVQTGTLTITDDQPGSPQVIQLSGTGTAPQVGFSPTTVTFPAQTVGTTSSPMTVTLTNTGGATLTISKISVTGNFTETNSCGEEVQPGGGICQISITFTPTAAGTLTGTLSVSDNATGSPQTVSLSGAGTTNNFTIGMASGSQSSQTISAGQKATFNLSVAPVSGFSGSVSLS